MLPLSNDFLPLEQIAEFWSREHNGVRTSLEIYDELLSAFWKNDLIVYNRDGKSPVGRPAVLRVIRVSLEHRGFVLIESSDQIPVRATKHPDGSVSVDMTKYIVLPSDADLWTSDILETAYEILATRSLADFADLVRPGLLALSTSRQALASYCDRVPYAKPRFWYPRSDEMKSFGGRPSIMRRIIAEMKRRAEEGLMAPKLREEARALRNWAEINSDSKVQLPQVGALENAIREPYNKLKAARSPAHKT